MRTPIAISLVSISLLVLSGCGERKSSSGQGATNTAASTPGSNPLNAPADYLGAIVKAKETAVKTVDTASLNEAIRMFHVEEGRYPKDLNELVQEKFIPRIPDAPYGMKIVYDASNGSIKIVQK